MKKLWQWTETDLLAGSLTSARCARCGGRGVYRQAVLTYDGGDLCEVEQELSCDCCQRPAELFRQANLPSGPSTGLRTGRFDGLTLADLDWKVIEPPGAATGVQDYAEHLEAWLAEGMGLTLTGRVGTGKTHVAVGLVKLACGLGIEARFLTMAELLGLLKSTYDGRGRETTLLDELTALPLLALDDLGTENPTPWAQDRLYNLVNRRYLAKRPIIATTNISLDDLANRLGERTISRLWGASLVVSFRGADYRERVKRQVLKRIRVQTNLRVAKRGS
jgi:DNA replication protein DnaC